MNETLTPEMSADPRIVYGAKCAWWDSIDKAGKIGPLNIPCCPHCKGVLYEMDSEAEWWKGADEYEKKEPGYRKFMEWLRGKCFKTFEEARQKYAELTRQEFPP